MRHAALFVVGVGEEMGVSSSLQAANANGRTTMLANKASIDRGNVVFFIGLRFNKI